MEASMWIYPNWPDSMTGDGKVIGCDNSGEIYADSQGGGIIGSISMETVKNAAKDSGSWIRRQ